ncbi:hypothetical protein BH09VER1_BH09VER1_24620 [soil metagenome]
MDELYTALRSALINLLGLAPVEGATEVTDAEITAKVAEINTAAGSAVDVGNKLTQAQAEVESIRSQLDELLQKEQAACQARDEAAADEILAQYKDRLTTPGSMASMRALLLENRESAVEILNGLPAAAASPVAEEPPLPTHKNPGEAGTVTPEQKAAEAESLIADLRKTKPAFKNYEDARNEIRRLRPDLFA